MGLFFSLVVFLYGLAVGSFLNCVIHRLQTGEFFTGRSSYCPHCQHQLKWPDLIPVLSFFILQGKCRYCQQKISWQYPLVELATAAIFILASLTIGNFYAMAFFLLISCFLIIIFVYDLKHCIIPDKVIYPAILVSGIWYFVSSVFFNFYTRYEILDTIYSAIGAAAFFLTMVLLSKGKWMGVGDIKLGFLMGLILGFPNILLALFLAFMTGAIIGVGLILSGKKSLKSEVPFGPFLVMGTFVALFYGQQIINWYLSFL